MHSHLNFPGWLSSNIPGFWNEVAVSNHSVQIYNSDHLLLTTLTGFAVTGFAAGECVIVIATSEHLEMLAERLYNESYDVNTLIKDGHYIPVNAEELLSKFLVERHIDEPLFKKTLREILQQASTNHRKVRAFGEMVAILWKKGFFTATVQLEQLWNEVHDKDPFTLFCAYPKDIFKQPLQDSVHILCKEHSTVINGESGTGDTIYYQSSTKN